MHIYSTIRTFLERKIKYIQQYISVRQDRFTAA